MYTIYLGSNLIYDTANKDSYPLSDENLKLKLSDSGSLEFKVYPGHPYYEELKHPYRYVTVYRDAEEIFYGRTLRYTSEMNGVIHVNCEGALTFLKDADMEKLSKTTETVSAFFTRCITAYNAQVESAKEFTIGQITVEKADSSETFEITRYQKIDDVISNQLVNRFGGFLRIRPNPNGPHFIDYLDLSDVIGNTNPQLIKIAENVINRENKVTGEKTFTVIRPLGEKDATIRGLLQSDVQIPDCEIHDDMLYLTDLMNDAGYGYVAETISFPNVTDKTKLLRDAESYITKIRGNLPASIEINYVDWHYMNPQTPYVSLGDAFTNLEGYTGQTMIVSELSLNLEDASKDTALFENSESLEENNNRNRGIGGGSTSSKGSFSGYAGQQWKHYSEVLDGVTQKAKINADEIDIIAGETLLLAGQVTEITSSGKMLLQVQESGQGGMLRLGVFDSIISEHQSYTISGVSLDNPTKTIHLDEIAEIKGADIWIDRDRVTTVAGQFLVENDPLHADAKFVKLIEGSTLQVRENGVYSAVASEGRVNTLITQTNDAITAEVTRATGAEASLQLTANGLTSRMQTAEGNISTLQQTANGLTSSVTTLNATKATVYRQWTDPVNNHPSGSIHDGDIWIQDNGVRLWGEADLWSDYGTQQWRDYYGSKLKVRANGQWVLQNDAPTIFEDGTRIDQTKEQVSIIAKKQEQDSTNLAQLAVRSDEISATVTSVQANQVTMSGQISVQAGKIGLVVEERQGQNVIKSASIVTAINDSGSSVIITADHIDLNGYVKATDLTANFIASKVADVGTLMVQNIMSSSVSGTATFYGVYGTHFYIKTNGSPAQWRNLEDVVYDIQIVPPSAGSNTYTLQKKTIYPDASWVTIGTFSRATSLSGAWSGSPAKYVVTASPQGTTLAYDPPMRLNGTTQASNFSAEITESTGGSTVARKSIYGHMSLTSNGASSYVDVIPGSSGSGTPVARLSVGSLYMDGRDYEIAHHSVQLYPGGNSDMGTSQQLPTGAVSLGSLAQLINSNVGRRLYVWFDAYVQDADGTYSAKKRYALAIN